MPYTCVNMPHASPLSSLQRAGMMFSRAHERHKDWRSHCWAMEYIKETGPTQSHQGWWKTNLLSRSHHCKTKQPRASEEAGAYPTISTDLSHSLLSCGFLDLTQASMVEFPHRASAYLSLLDEVTQLEKVSAKESGIHKAHPFEMLTPWEILNYLTLGTAIQHSWQGSYTAKMIQP